MENLRESDVVATKFWQQFVELAPAGVDVAQSYRHGLLLLFLFNEARSPNLMQAIVEAMRLEPDPETSDRRLNKLLRDPELLPKWLASTSPSTYIGRIESAYVAVVTALRLHRVEPLGFGTDAHWPVEQYRFVRAWTETNGDHWLLLTYDRGLNVLTSDRTDVVREHFAAQLAASCMFSRGRQIADLYSPTARFATALADRDPAHIRCLVGRTAADHFTAMRLHLQDIEFEYVEPADVFENYRNADLDMILVNPSVAPSGNQVSIDFEFDRPSQRTPAVGLASLLEELLPRAGFALIVVPQADCRSSQWPKEHRRRVVEGGNLLAVIDFPRNAASGNRKFSAWLLAGSASKMRFQHNGILFIDAEPLARLMPHADTGLSADFVGALVATSIGLPTARANLIDRLSNLEPLLSSIFRREFKADGYEAAGLSIVVSHQEVEKKGYALCAREYLSTAQDDLWSAGIRRGELDALLRNDSATGNRIYVIGNNGEGKSQLLSEVAREMARSGQRTIAIAFGITDRFPKRMTGFAAKNYRYMGARTGAASVNAVQTAVDAGGLMLTISADKTRMSVLEELLELVGFSSQHFLIPREQTADTAGRDRLLSGIVRLPSEDTLDHSVLETLRSKPVMARKYKLGLRRRDNDHILPFDELSSGEQQIILLISKMVSEAGRGVLFIVDEPEISLHVSWQQAVPKLLRIIAERFRATIFTATHSPVVIASADARGDHCFTVRDRALERLLPESRRSVETALFEGFRTYTVNNREVHERCASLVAEFVATANSDMGDKEAAAAVLEKLEEMKQVINNQRRFAQRQDMIFDLSLITRAQAAVREIASFAPSEPAQGVDE